MHGWIGGKKKTTLTTTHTHTHRTIHTFISRNIIDDNEVGLNDWNINYSNRLLSKIYSLLNRPDIVAANNGC